MIPRRAYVPHVTGGRASVDSSTATIGRICRYGCSRNRHRSGDRPGLVQDCRLDFLPPAGAGDSNSFMLRVQCGRVGALIPRGFLLVLASMSAQRAGAEESRQAVTASPAANMFVAALTSACPVNEQVVHRNTAWLRGFRIHLPHFEPRCDVYAPPPRRSRCSAAEASANANCAIPWRGWHG